MLWQSVQLDLQAGLENDSAVGLQSILSKIQGWRLMFRFAMTPAGFYKAACKKLQAFSFIFFDSIQCCH
jgi:hypothetical protein